MEEKKDKLRRPRGHHLRRRRHKCLSLANLILFKGFDGLKTLERAFDFTMASRKFLTWRRTRWRHYGSTAHQPRPRFFLLLWPLLFHSPPLFQIIALPPSFASRGTAATAERERAILIDFCAFTMSCARRGPHVVVDTFDSISLISSSPFLSHSAIALLFYASIILMISCFFLSLFPFLPADTRRRPDMDSRTSRPPWLTTPSSGSSPLAPNPELFECKFDASSHFPCLDCERCKNFQDTEEWKLLVLLASSSVCVF